MTRKVLIVVGVMLAVGGWFLRTTHQAWDYDKHYERDGALVIILGAGTLAAGLVTKMKPDKE